MSDCIFCKNLPKVIENELAYVLYDINPISKGHTLIIPKRHFEQIFEATPDESSAIKDLIGKMKQRLDQEHVPDGYNIWINSGKAAGQVVMHAHVHLIPRFKGQVLHIKDHLKGNIE
ncbi:MAG: HIT domain-containing protein [Candidatus Omnitrophica bacterium]|nr:HIT domain-containing protein [Candidatus Omnitrophota bacterium]